MTDLDFMGYKRVISQVRSGAEHCWHSVTLSRMVGTARMCLRASPKGESKSNGEVERAVQSVHRLARTLTGLLGAAVWNHHCKSIYYMRSFFRCSEYFL